VPQPTAPPRTPCVTVLSITNFDPLNRFLKNELRILC
jgi:hypothetical protein